MKQCANRQPTAASDIEQVKEDIFAHTRDLASLIDKMTVNAADGFGDLVRESAEQLGDKARMLYETLGAQKHWAPRASDQRKL
jgi:hypothetical protein